MEILQYERKTAVKKENKYVYSLGEEFLTLSSTSVLWLSHAYASLKSSKT